MHQRGTHACDSTIGLDLRREIPATRALLARETRFGDESRTDLVLPDAPLAQLDRVTCPLVLDQLKWGFSILSAPATFYPVFLPLLVEVFPDEVSLAGAHPDEEAVWAVVGPFGIPVGVSAICLRLPYVFPEIFAGSLSTAVAVRAVVSNP